MDNKEIAQNLTIAAMNNQLVGNKKLIEADLVHEEVFDFYFAILDKLNTQDESEV